MWKAGYWTKLRDCSEFLAKGSGHNSTGISEGKNAEE